MTDKQTTPADLENMPFSKVQRRFPLPASEPIDMEAEIAMLRLQSARSLPHEPGPFQNDHQLRAPCRR